MSNARNVRIETHGPVKLAGLAHTGPYIDIGGSFEKTATYAHGMGLFAAKTQMIGLYYDDPGSVPAQALRSFAAITIDDTVKADTIAPLEIRDLPAGRYASTVHEGSYANLHKSWDWLYGVWLPQSGEEPADAPGVEDYLNNPRDVAPPDLRTVLRIKLKD